MAAINPYRISLRDMIAILPAMNAAGAIQVDTVEVM